MILYIDSSALVKRYVVEAGTPEVESLLATADLAGTALISRAEVSAAICKAARMGIVDRDKASASVKLFRAHWPALFRLRVDGIVVESADLLAWEHQLRVMTLCTWPALFSGRIRWRSQSRWPPSIRSCGVPGDMQAWMSGRVPRK